MSRMSRWVLLASSGLVLGGGCIGGADNSLVVHAIDFIAAALVGGAISGGLAGIGT
jgi:hypothetical protein